MSALQKNSGMGMGKGSMIAVAIFGAVLVIASIYSVSLALHKSGVASGDASLSSDATAPAQTNFITQEEIDSQHARYQPPPPVAATVAVPPAAAPTNLNNDEVILRKAKARVNNLIVERQKKYVKEHPSRDHRELEKQIKIRENSGAKIQ